MRFLLPIMALCALSSVPLRADTFDITFTTTGGSATGTGSFTTDGVCTMCTPGAGLLSVNINIGTDAFDISDDTVSPLTEYIRSSNTFKYVATSSESSDVLAIGFPQSNTWNVNTHVKAVGTFTIAPAVPEPSSVVLLITIVGIVALLGLSFKHPRSAQQ